MDEIAYMFLGAADEEEEQQQPQEEQQPPPPPTPKATAPSVPKISVDTSKAGYKSHPKLEMTTDASNDSHARAPSPPLSPTPTTPKRRLGFRDLLSKANIQDQLLNKLFQQVIPIDSSYTDEDSEINYGDPSFGAPPNPGDGPTEIGNSMGGVGYDADVGDGPPKKVRPGFSVAIMSNNFRRFNARIGVVFRFQKKVERLLSWRRTSHTVAFLGTYTIVCLDPYLLTLAPPAVLLLSVLIPGFIARHPGTSTTNTPTLVLPSEYYARGPPLAPPRTVKPVKELSRDFFRNMGDLQNSMEDFSVAHDNIVNAVVPATNFADEAFSSALFVVLCGASLFLSVAAHLLPYRLIFLVGGWAVVGSQHPAVARLIRIWTRSLNESMAAASAEAAAAAEKDAAGDASASEKAMLQASPSSTLAAIWNAWVASDIILDEAPETREVEIFELQHRSSPDAAEWEPWVFSASPFDPLSQSRLNANASSSPGLSPGGYYGNGRPTGARFFEDVLPPHGWEWSEKKWALDLWSRDWVEERIITGVEVETEGERWVYDMLNEHEQQQQQAAAAAAAASASSANYEYGDSDYYADNSTGLHPPPTAFRPQRRPLGPSWEEGEEGMGRRGEWRRRRWVRMVKRKKITAVA